MMKNLRIEKDLPLYGKGIAKVSFFTDLVGEGSFLCLNSEAERIVEYCREYDIPAVSVVSSHILNNSWIVLLSDLVEECEEVDPYNYQYGE